MSFFGNAFDHDEKVNHLDIICRPVAYIYRIAVLYRCQHPVLGLNYQKLLKIKLGSVSAGRLYIYLFKDSCSYLSSSSSYLSFSKDVCGIVSKTNNIRVIVVVQRCRSADCFSRAISNMCLVQFLWSGRSGPPFLCELLSACHQLLRLSFAVTFKALEISPQININRRLATPI